MRKRKIIRHILILCSFIFLCSCTSPVKADTTPEPETEPVVCIPQKGMLSVYFIRAGKADSILVKTANHAYLIDTGTEKSLPSIFGVLHMMDVKKLDAVFCTHTHDDHIGGLKGVLREIPVDTVYRSEISEENKKGQNKIDKKADCEVTILKAGDTIPVENGIRFDVLGPVVENTEDDNDNSLVLKLTAGNVRYLFTGDMQNEEEQTLLSMNADLKADVLKIGNHGNPDATGDEFARAVNPSYCVVTTDRLEDENSANHSVLSRFPNAEIYCTDETEQGVLFTQTDDDTIHVSEPYMTGNRDFSGLLIDRTEQILTIKNTGNNLDISLSMLATDSGNGFCRFPENTVLKRGDSITVCGEKQTGDYAVSEKKPFSKKNGKLLLFDEYGNVVRIFE